MYNKTIHLKNDPYFKYFKIVHSKEKGFRLILSSRTRVESLYRDKTICNFVLHDLDKRSDEEILKFISKTKDRVS